MDLLQELERVVGVLQREHIDFALCGDLAVNVYGHVRATRDIDVLVRRRTSTACAVRSRRSATRCARKAMRC